MADTVGNLNVKLGADSSQAESGLKQFRDSLAQTVSRVDPMVNAVNKLTSAFTGFNIGGFAGQFQSVFQPLQNFVNNAMNRNIAGMASDTVNLVTTLANLGREGLNTVASQSKLADQLGTTQEAIAGLTDIARRAGQEAEVFQTAFGRFSGEMGRLREEVFAGNFDSPLSRSLRRMSIDVQELALLRPEQQLGRIGDALQRINGQDRRAIAESIFGGPRFVGAFTPFLYGRERGSSGIDNAMREVVEQGRGGAEFARQAREADRAMKELKHSFDNIFQQFSIEIGLAFAPMTKDLSEWLKDHGPEVRNWFRELARDIKDTAEVTAGFVRNVRDLIRETQNLNAQGHRGNELDSQTRVRSDALRQLEALNRGEQTPFWREVERRRQAGTLENPVQVEGALRRDMAERWQATYREVRRLQMDAFLGSPLGQMISEFGQRVFSGPPVATPPSEAYTYSTPAGQTMGPMIPDDLRNARQLETRTREADASARQLLETWRESRQTIGLAGDELELFRRRQAGASSEMLQSLREASAQRGLANYLMSMASKPVMTEQVRFAGPAIQGSVEAYRAMIAMMQDDSKRRMSAEEIVARFAPQWVEEQQKTREIQEQIRDILGQGGFIPAGGF